MVASWNKAISKCNTTHERTLAQNSHKSINFYQLLWRGKRNKNQHVSGYHNLKRAVTNGNKLKKGKESENQVLQSAVKEIGKSQLRLYITAIQVSEN